VGTYSDGIFNLSASQTGGSGENTPIMSTPSASSSSADDGVIEDGLRHRSANGGASSGDKGGASSGTDGPGDGSDGPGGVSTNQSSSGRVITSQQASKNSITVMNNNNNGNLTYAVSPANSRNGRGGPGARTPVSANGNASPINGTINGNASPVGGASPGNNFRRTTNNRLPHPQTKPIPPITTLHVTSIGGPTGKSGADEEALNRSGHCKTLLIKIWSRGDEVALNRSGHCKISGR
jgi:hypothetical protein